MFYTRLLGLLTALLLVQSLAAQDKLSGFWRPNIALNYKVTETYAHNFRVRANSQIFRGANSAFDVEYFDISHFSTFRIRDDQNLSLGIMWRANELFEVGRVNELRLTQQYNIVWKPLVVRYGFRLRAEQRISRPLTVHRLRGRFAVDLPLEGESLDVGEAYLVGSTESLLSMGRGLSPRFDQRFTLQIGWKLSPISRLQIGLEYRAIDLADELEHDIYLETGLIFLLQ